MVKNLEASFSGSSQLFVIVIVVGYVFINQEEQQKAKDLPQRADTGVLKHSKFTRTYSFAMM